MCRCGCRQNLYDGIEEYWVTVRETGSRVESLTHEQQQRDKKKASRHEQTQLSQKP